MPTTIPISPRTSPAFDKQYGLSAPPSFTVDNLGATTTNAGWALETSLDVEWAHAIAPEANIVLVEAAIAQSDQLVQRGQFRQQAAGGERGLDELGDERVPRRVGYDSVFTTPAGHANVTYVAASGDTGRGSGPEYPVGFAQRPGRRRHDT